MAVQRLWKDRQKPPQHETTPQGESDLLHRLENDSGLLPHEQFRLLSVRPN